MEKRERYKRLIIYFATTVLMAIQTGIFMHVWFTCFEDIGSNYFNRGNYVLIIQYALMLFLFNKVFGGFQLGRRRIIEMIFSEFISILFVNAITYLELSLIGRWEFMTNVEPIAIMTLFDLLVAAVWVIFTRWLYVKVFPPRKILVVYGNYSPDNLIRKLERKKDKYTIQEKISIDCDINEIKAKISEHRNVILTDIPAELRNELLKYCFRKNIRCYSVPKISDIMIMNSESIHLFDTSMLLFRNIGLTAEQQFIKRVMDIVISLLVLMIFLPVMFLIALAIKLYDRGPVFFTQDRLTRDGAVFKLIKFRSMRVHDEDEEYCLTRKNDSRITPIGKLIRDLHLDELPQLFNILKGDMSFVGPRPECPKLAEEYRQVVPEFDFRLKVKAGLTGYAQVYGKYNTTPYDKLKLDLVYISKYSLIMDFKLILLTIKILFQKENTEGIESWQTSADPKNKLDKQ